MRTLKAYPPSWTAHALLILALAAPGAQQLTAQNLLINPHFDTDFTGWGGGSSTFDGALDVNGSPASGSAKTINDSIQASVSEGGASQCVGGIVPLASYHVGIQVFVPTGQAVTGSGFACISWFSGS